MSEDIKDLTVPESDQIEVVEEPITLNPIDLDKATTWEDFISLWMISKDIDMRNQWFKGDISNRVAIIHGEGSLTKFAQDVQEKLTTIESYRRVSRAFPKDMRNLNLSWTHYFIASFTDSFKKGASKFEGDARFGWVEKANDEGWSTTRLAEEIKKQHALVDSKQAIFDYYDNYLGKVSHVLCHMEKNQITKEEAQKLLDKLMEIHGEFTTYLEDVK